MIDGIALLGSILLSFGCLVAAFRSLASIVKGYDRESRLMAITGFVGGLIASAVFGLITIILLNRLEGFAQMGE